MPERKPEKDILGEEELNERGEEKEEAKFSPRPSWLLIAFVFLLALLPRLYTIFVLTDPQNPGINWYEDVYHHWQVGYLTWKIGLHEGFRPWDLKGMEYFWGIGHPFILTFISALTGLYDIVVSRVLSAVFGSLVVMFAFLISHRFWGMKIALAVALFGALHQVGIFNDATGMIEPLGLAPILLAIYLWPKSSFLSGVLLGFSTFIRAETWIFAVGIFLAMLLFEKDFDKKVVFLLSFATINIFHMKYLLDKTDNPIYPVYWNFMGNAVGKWMFAPTLTKIQEQIKPVFVALIVPSVLGILWTFLWTLWKKIRYFAFLFLGFGNWFFIAGMFGLTMYIKAYYGHLVWATRFFTFPYFFAGVLLIIFLFKTIGQIRFLSIFAWIAVFAVILATQLVWTPVLARYESQKGDWEKVQEMAHRLRENYVGGRVLIPEGIPSFTYAMVRYQGFEAKDFIGEMYDPFFYMEDEDPFDNWEDHREDVLSWLKREDIRLMFFPRVGKEVYSKLIEKEPKFFEFKENADGAFLIYKVFPDLIEVELEDQTS